MSQNQTKGTRKIILDRVHDARDVFEFNGFWAKKPSRVRLVMEEEGQTGLWQLVIYDLEGSKSWRLGAYIDGYEGRRTLYDMTLAYYYGRYIDDSEEARRYDITNDVIKEWGGEFIVRLPNEWRTEVEIRIPALCGAGYPLAEPVYLGTVDNRYFALDCVADLYRFDTLEELEDWVKERKCPEGHEYPVIHWWEWHIVRNGEVVYSEYVQPAPQDVIKTLHQYLT
jgi:hypothetical protein